jgi:succinyl-diaminopimelate desuccinylase
VTDPVALAQALIRCASVTPADAGAQQALKDALVPLGFTCHDVPFGDIRNLFARLGDGGPHLCFCGHTDVVPAGDESRWTHPPFGAEIADGVLYGRGASDMKGNIACFIAAIAAYIEKHGPPPGSVSLLITGDEEAAAIDGTVRVLPWMKEHGHNPDAALVGEPTNPDTLGQEIKIGRRGSLTGTLTVTGTQGHTAYPQRADNPLPRLVRYLDTLASQVFDEGAEFFQPTNLQITTIDVGNPAANVIPGKGAAVFNVRFSAAWSAATLEARIRAILDTVGTDYALSCASNAESFMTQPGPLSAAMQDAVAAVTGRTPALTTTGGTSDARFVQAYCPVVEFGLTNATIHKTDESARVDDLHTLTAIYAKFLENYFSG